MPETEAAFEFVRDLGQINVKSLRLRIHLFLVRRPHDVVALGLELRTVVFEGPWVFLEVLALPELKPVDEDRGDRHGGEVTRDAHEAQVPVMDVAHGRHARDLRFTFEPFAQFGDRFDDFHLLRD